MFITRFTDLRKVEPHKGLKSICTNLHATAKTNNITLNFQTCITTNWARHSWATIARNDCQVSKSDVAMCLGHGSNTVTDYYIKPDFTLVDAVNRKVLDKIFNR